jgi:hypothetical protein
MLIFLPKLTEVAFSPSNERALYKKDAIKIVSSLCA